MNNFIKNDLMNEKYDGKLVKIILLDKLNKLHSVYKTYDNSKLDIICNKLQKYIYKTNYVNIHKHSNLEMHISSNTQDSQNTITRYFKNNTVDVIVNNKFIASIHEINSIDQDEFPLKKDYDLNTNESIKIYTINKINIELNTSSDGFCYVYVTFTYDHSNKQYIEQSLIKILNILIC